MASNWKDKRVFLTKRKMVTSHLCSICTAPQVAGDDPEEIAATQKAGTNAALNIADKDFSGKTDHIFTETTAVSHNCWSIKVAS